MAISTSSRVLRAALFTLVPLAYLSMPYWHPSWLESFPGYFGPPEWALASLMASVFLVSLLSRRTYRIVAILGFLICFLWLCAFLLPVA
jgi:hypothetical protein